MRCFCMSTKQTLSLLGLLGLIPLAVWLTFKAGFGDYVFLEILGSLLGVPLLIYAFVREQTTSDKSEGVPKKAVITTFCVIAAWVIYCAWRTLSS